MGGHAHRRWEEAHGAPPAAVCAGCGLALNAILAYRSLLAGAIEYAGLFPPASLAMSDAVREYDQHRRAPDSWALGRFVVPLARWDEFRKERARLDGADFPWPVSLLAAISDADGVRAVMASDERFSVQALEVKASSPDEAGRAVSLLSTGAEVFVEPASLNDVEKITTILEGTGASAKIRTGGVTADAFPSPSQVLAFLSACRRHGLRFKATAGLHHAVRGEYRLTYEPSSPTGVMFGFLNVGMAAALLWFGHDERIALEALQERSADAFEFSDAGVAWRAARLTPQQLDEVRAEFFVGFGSCSVREPMAELGLEALPRA